jgi:hypothetical protein
VSFASGSGEGNQGQQGQNEDYMAAAKIELATVVLPNLLMKLILKKAP